MSKNKNINIHQESSKGKAAEVINQNEGSSTKGTVKR